MLQQFYRRMPGNLIIIISLLAFLIFHYQPMHNFSEIDIPADISVYLNLSRNFAPLLPRPTPPPPLELPASLPPTYTQLCSCPTATPLSFSKPETCKSPQEATPEQETVARLRDEGIVVIFKTGAQEVSRLAIHLATTLRYLDERDILFFSDLQGSIGPFLVNDALRNVDQKIRQEHPDFEIYREIRRYQSTGQDIGELKEDRSKGAGRSGWRLDKYKFIHMVEETFEMRPDAKWYVFVETDSYVVWTNLADWLKMLDSTKPIYLGAAVSSGDYAFAHGGSGYVLSNAAMIKLLGPDQPQGLAASWDVRMKDQCCGDIALGIALHEKGVILTGARPYLNGYKPSSLTYGPNNHWCQPVITMHHLLPHEISNMWRFERRREMLMGHPNATMFSELYFHFVEPHLSEKRENWDNLSHGPTYSKEEEGKRREEEEKEFNRENELKREREQLKKEESEKTAADQKKNENEKERKAKSKDADEKKSGNNANGNGNPNSKEVARTTDHQGDPLSKTRNKDEKEAEKRLKDTPFVSKDKSTEGEKLGKRTVERISDAERNAHLSFEKCAQACEKNDQCFQYVYFDEVCKLGLSFRLGQYVAPKGPKGDIVYKSGWMLTRIREWQEANSCKEPQWPELFIE